MQQHTEFSFAMNGPRLNVRKVEDLDGLLAGPYCRILIAPNGLWYAELESETDQNHDAYFIKALDAAKILICATIYECVDLVDVDISSQIGRHCAIVTSNGIYARSIGGILPLQIAGAMCHKEFARQMDYRGPMFMGDYQPVVPPQQYGYQVPPIMNEVIIPGIRSAGGKLVDHGGFLHWVPSGAHRPKPIPVVNPTVGFETRLDLEQTIRQALTLLQRNGYYPSSPQSYQHRFDMSSSQRDQQEIG